MSIHLAALCSTATLTELTQILQPMNSAVYKRQLANNRGDSISSIGSHCRHVIEFYHCFFQGLSQGTIDYDSRERSPLIEQDKLVALTNLESVCEMLKLMPSTNDPEKPLQLRTEIDSEKTTITFGTSIVRELIFLQSHSIHHLALIALLLNNYGQSVPVSFGLANSTRSYNSRAKMN